MDTHTKNLLLALGSTPDEVAQTIQSLGIKGVRIASNHDTINNCIKQYLVRNSIDIVQWWNDEGMVAHQFDRAFDDGKYPFLERT